MRLGSRHINHILGWSLSTWISSFGKSKGRPWQFGFCNSGIQGWARHLWGFCGSLLREVQGRHVRCRFESVKILKWAWAGRGPIWVTQIQMWADLSRTDSGLDLAMEDKGTPCVVGGSCSPLRATTATWVPGDTWRWVLLCVGNVAICCCIIYCCCRMWVRRSVLLRRWIACRLWGKKPLKGWNVGKEQMAVVRQSNPVSSDLTPCFVSND